MIRQLTLQPAPFVLPIHPPSHGSKTNHEEAATTLLAVCGPQALKVLLQYLAEKPHKFVRARLSFYHPQARGLKGLIQGGRDLVGFHKHDAGGRSTVRQPHIRNRKSGPEALPTGTGGP